MKACPATKVLREMKDAGIWIDAVSGNEVLRALRAGHSAGQSAAGDLLHRRCLPRQRARGGARERASCRTSARPGMIARARGGRLSRADFAPRQSGLRPRPRERLRHRRPEFEARHLVRGSCSRRKDAAEQAGMRGRRCCTRTSAAVRSIQELHENLTRLALEFVELLPNFPKLDAVSLGGGIPHNYRDHGAQVPVEPLHELFDDLPRTRSAPRRGASCGSRSSRAATTWRRAARWSRASPT